MAAATHIDDFIQALRDEIAEIKKSGKGPSVALTDGRPTGKIGSFFVYSFNLPRIISAEDDTPGQLEVDGEKHDCSVVSVSGLVLNLAVSKNLGDVASARLIMNQTQVLSRLIEKFEEAKKNEGAFKFAEEIFAGKNKPLNIRHNGGKPQYTFETDNAPNSSQAAAIANTYANSLAVIWGPPGTGKTRTIARAVQAHVQAGRKVLLVSHANMAVDAALEDIAEQMSETAYAEGKIVRLGVPKNPKLKEKYPLLIIDQILNVTNAPLIARKDEIESGVAVLEQKLSLCKKFQRVVAETIKLEQEIQRPKELTDRQERHQKVLSDIAHHQAQLQHLQRGVAGPGSTLETQIRDLTIRIPSLQRMADEMAEKIGKIASGSADKQAELDAAHLEFDRLMHACGITPNEIDGRLSTLQKGLSEAQKALADIEAKLAGGFKNVIDGAVVIGTTLTKVFLSGLLTESMFDTIVVDEASMVPMPHLYFALSKVKDSAIIVGDFKQLPPIARADTALALRWLKRHIFSELDIDTVPKAKVSPLVSLLDTQFRMTPEIADISSEMYYGNLLKSAGRTRELGFEDSVFGNSRVVFIDTSEVDPWLVSGSRLNLYSAGLVINTCQRLLAEHPNISVGVASPYNAQAEFIAKSVNESGYGERALISTVHKFQGGESTVIIFDCVDGQGSGNFSMLAKQPDAEVLLNVAMTRARAKFIVVGSRKYFNEKFRDSPICKLFDRLIETARIVPARSVDGGFTVSSLEDHGPVSFVSAVFNQDDFWSPFRVDLYNARREVVMLCPFLTVRRSARFFALFKQMVEGGVRVVLHTKPAGEHTADHMIKEARSVIDELTKIGVRVLERPKLHQKIVIIDDYVCWEGSLNILSHHKTLEHMRRLTGSAIAGELKRALEL